MRYARVETIVQTVALEVYVFRQAVVERIVAQVEAIELPWQIGIPNVVDLWDPGQRVTRRAIGLARRRRRYLKNHSSLRFSPMQSIHFPSRNEAFSRNKVAFYRNGLVCLSKRSVSASGTLICRFAGIFRGLEIRDDVTCPLFSGGNRCILDDNLTGCAFPRREKRSSFYRFARRGSRRAPLAAK